MLISSSTDILLRKSDPVDLAHLSFTLSKGAVKKAAAPAAAPATEASISGQHSAVGDFGEATSEPLRLFAIFPNCCGAEIDAAKQ